MTAPIANAVVLEGVTVAYPPRVVLDCFDARLEPGMTALMGPSGSGKTTLLSVVAGLVDPDSGTVTVPDALRHPTGMGAGWIMQSANVLARRTALDNVTLTVMALGVPRPEAEERAKKALGALGLGTLALQVSGKLSGGERQRVAVARALAADAPLVLADEPTASLGPVHKALVIDHLAAIAARGRVVAVATHDPWVASRCDRVIELAGG